MLGKLIKHEFIADSRMMLPSYGVVLLLAAFGRLFTWLATRQAIVDSLPSSFVKVLQGISSLLSVAYVLAFIALLILTMVFLIYRFYKNFFTDEGYLMMTLPAKPWQLILSKLVNAVIWVVLSVVAAGASLVITFSHYEEMMDTMKNIASVFTDMMSAEEVKEQFGVSFYGFLAEIAGLMVFMLIFFIIVWYFSIAVGQLISKSHKMGGAILSYVVVTFATQIFSSAFFFVENKLLVTVIPGYASITGVATQTTIIGLAVLLLLLSALLYWGTSMIMTRRLNLD